MAVRIFLYLIAGIIALILAAGVVWTVFSDELLAWYFVPDAPLEVLEPMPESEYAAADMWLIRPDIANPASDWLPDNYVDHDADEIIDEETEAAAAPEGERIPVFYVLPTTYLDSDRWNAPLRSPAALERQRLFASSQASVFNDIGEVWAPLYRQAVIGAFMTERRESEVSLHYAYRDVEAAFDYFLSQIGEDRPFILAGHSQGALHLLTLLREHIAGTDAQGRIAAAYIIGWPISVEADLPALPLPPCETARSSNCIIAFQSFADPADPHQVRRIYDETTGYTGAPRRETSLLCINPLTGTRDGVAGAEANNGALVPDGNMENATLEPNRIPARCDEQGLLVIGQPPEGYDRYVLPGNNYHVFDFLLFWANLREDVARRTSAFEAGLRDAA
ncbi:DUF3089 domain-containing protein [Parasphingopyxis marina]|uniref:DUF3089 domain-containing protein n=1 Tax=Parasphingopyxis marina TaxID=2761622 RepID=A0A842HYU4_9SPHN|nr:DUF3089 domain-containing protein [Parasphingopyxis marina]MBC2778102.1 DUF3089 domain-containing protein [Parasphingopyxis marina]